MPISPGRDLRTALMLLTRLPIPPGRDTADMGTVAWAFPLTGLVLALIAASAGGLAAWMGFSATLIAAFPLAALTITTGAMHEDGLADTADGFWGGWDRTRRLEIMKDSHIGTYGVLALILSFAARWAALTALIENDNWVWPLIAAACISRSTMAVVMYALPHARSSGLSHHVGRPDRQTVLLGAAIAAIIALIATGTTALSLVLIAAIITIAMMALARAKIGGQTGDVLGATQQICEVSLLAALSF